MIIQGYVLPFLFGKCHYLIIVIQYYVHWVQPDNSVRAEFSPGLERGTVGYSPSDRREPVLKMHPFLLYNIML